MTNTTNYHTTNFNRWANFQSTNITKFIKKEIREEKAKQARIDASKSEQQAQEQSEIEITDDVVEEEAPDAVVEATSEDEPSEVIEEKTE